MQPDFSLGLGTSSAQPKMATFQSGKGLTLGTNGITLGINGVSLGLLWGFSLGFL